jgi:hypothetical protein
MRLLVKVLAFVVVAVCVYIFFANPWNWFVRRSDHFSEEKFLAIKPGISIEEVVKILGKPLRTIKIDADYGQCPSCTSYYFMGDPPDWLVSFKEAWILVSPDGKVRSTVLNLEP